ncbi:hypothetical protein [Nonomuraea sp. LPB2021202275-12-8]|uniref:hypothetical protein n=1 Tax=Nonomuraea sp. LPB2021202275-12-8 TaxID=3120159 RepID=UPI00300C0CB8
MTWRASFARIPAGRALLAAGQEGQLVPRRWDAPAWSRPRLMDLAVVQTPAARSPQTATTKMNGEASMEPP